MWIERTAVLVTCLVSTLVITVKGQDWAGMPVLCSPLTRSVGTCNETCTSNVTYTHKWGISLCGENSPLQCCAPVGTQERPPTTTTPAPIPPVSAQCGMTPARTQERKKRIAGGSAASYGSWPWIAGMIFLSGPRLCAAAFIDQRWAVTAAHCFKMTSDPNWWRLRELHNVNSRNKDIPISRIILHRDYVPSIATNGVFYPSQQSKHDLALVQLAGDHESQTICLPSTTDAQGLSSLESNGECWVAGWGASHANDHTQGNVLREVEASLINSTQCGDWYGTTLEDDTSCHFENNTGVCSGDSGGPLSCKLNGRWYLGGVVSWGVENCNVTIHPEVFTRVTHPDVLTWITDTINDPQYN